MFGSPIAGTAMAELFYGAYRDDGLRDYECGVKYYAGHTGTDILLRNFGVQDSGVGVLAVAPGRVAQVEDGHFDRSTQNGGVGFGNHVVVEHTPSTVSIYAHLRNGSIGVAPGTSVSTGDTLGLVGSSGNSNWPHLHFEVRESGQPVDPFIGPCYPNGLPTWQAQLSYQNEFRVLDAGLTTRAFVSLAHLLERPADDTVVRPEHGSVLAWLNLFNIQADLVRARLEDAAGNVLAESVIGTFTTFSARFYTVRFEVGVLATAGLYRVVVRQQPLGGTDELEIHRLQFRFDPGLTPAPGAARRATSAPVVWLGPDAGDRPIR